MSGACDSDACLRLPPRPRFTPDYLPVNRQAARKVDSSNNMFPATHRSENTVTFTINGKKYTVDENLPVYTSLNTFIRDHANLRGTKAMCHEGGCGVCLVAVTSDHPFKETSMTYAVNSCLTSVFSCHGWDITTVEGIGNKKKGYHPVQARLALMNGTQCGYCSPGMVMNMYSLLEGGEVTIKDVENSFGGNICRCTGYRPILDAFKSLSVNTPSDLLMKVQDIEDIHKIKICPKTEKACNGNCNGNEVHLNYNGTNFIKYDSSIHLQLKGSQWFKVRKAEEIFEIFDKVGDVPYRLVAGNTGQGVYRVTEEPKAYIDVGDVAELKSLSTRPNLILGGNMSLTEAMALFYSLSKDNPRYKYTRVLADHIDLIANVPVRNTGTIAGNLAMKHERNEFPSDIYLMLETVGATLNIAQKGEILKNVNMLAFLDMDMKHKIIHSINMPELDENYHLRTFKIMPRAQNAHAYVNAGFLFKINVSDSGKVLTKPTIVFGGINPEFIHASNTESYVNGKNLFDRKVLRTALKILDTELHPDHVLPDASPKYRKGLAEALFYKYVLGLSPPNLPENLVSGGKLLERPVSTGKQDFETNQSVWPLTKPVPKLEAFTQCSGEAQYVNDIPTIPGEVYAAFSLTTVGQGYIANIDPSEILDMPGVVAFLSAKDIPGKNSFTPVGLMMIFEDEEMFCSGNIKYAGQPFGLVVAESQKLAHEAALKVKVEYSNVQKPHLDMRQIIATGDKTRIRVEKQPEHELQGKEEAANVIKGSFDIGSQYHYTMEVQSCVCVPIEDGIDVYPASQWMDCVQIAISQVLNIPENSININVRRLGGGYGAKISRSSLVATSCALATHILQRPVRFVMDLETNMAAMGKRFRAAIDYEIGTNDDGKIQYMKADIYEDAGCHWNEPVSFMTIEHMKSCYDAKNWAVTGFAVRTDIASNTYCRAPGSAEGIAFAETIMEHIAKVLKKDPLEVRIKNLKNDDSTILNMMEEFKVTAQYEERKQNVEEFNRRQRWRKRGIAVVPMTYGFNLWGNFSVMVSIYARDGTVAVTHGGIEMGQGINTKVAQVVAHILNIPLEFVSVKPSNNLTSPNGMVTGGSIASDACSYASMACCKELLKRMEPAKVSLKNPTWQQWTQAAHEQQIDLCATYMFTPKDLKPYNIYGVTIGEVEVDLLTGQHQILRVDILEDAGESLSPEVDIGQVEGAFVMGLGYWLMEYLTFNPETGMLLTNRTWNYKPPGVKDIPIDFRVYLRKKAPNPFGVLRSKATGEPPLCMSSVVLFALRNALSAARQDAGKPDEWYPMSAPATTENIFLTSLTNIDMFSL